MSIRERIQGYLGKETVEKSPEELRIAALKGRIEELNKERNRLLRDGARPVVWGANLTFDQIDRSAGREVNPRLEQINQDIENLNREIQGLPPLSFHGSKR